MCFPRAVVTAQAIVNGDPQKDTIVRGDNLKCTLQRRLALDLMERAGLAGHRGGCGMHEFDRIQNVLLPNYQLKIFHAGDLKEILFCGNCFY